MRDSAYYIEEIKKAQGVQSDYAVAKLLGVSKQAIPNYRSGRSSFDSNLAFKVAELSGHDPAEIVLDMKAMKEKDPDFSRRWAELARRVAQKSGTAAAGVILSLSLVGHSPETRAAVDSPAPAPTQGAGALYIMLSKARSLVGRFMQAVGDLCKPALSPLYA